MNEYEDILPGYARVTQILSPYADFSKIDPYVLANAANRGTRVHSYCEEYCKVAAIHAEDFFDLSSVDEHCMGYVVSFIDWYKTAVHKVHLQEKRLYSELHLYTGKLDLVVSIKGEEDSFVLVDIKTPQQPSKTWALQSAAYHLLLTENDLMNCDRRFTLILDKHGSHARVIEYDNLPRDELLFMHAARLYRFFNL